jgi:hypothetical protein
MTELSDEEISYSVQSSVRETENLSVDSVSGTCGSVSTTERAVTDMQADSSSKRGKCESTSNNMSLVVTQTAIDGVERGTCFLPNMSHVQREK